MHDARGGEKFEGSIIPANANGTAKGTAQHGALLCTLTDRACSLHVGVEEGAQVGAEGVQQPTYPADG